MSMAKINDRERQCGPSVHIDVTMLHIDVTTSGIFFMKMVFEGDRPRLECLSMSTVGTFVILFLRPCHLVIKK